MTKTTKTSKTRKVTKTRKAQGVEQHFVIFYSPGTFTSEVTKKPIASWNVATAKRMARHISERYSATPYGFRFTTQARSAKELDSQTVKTSHMYYLGGVVETLKDVKARAMKDDEILVSNMECNNIDRIITNTNSWKVTFQLHPEDVVLTWKP
jgi:hypothetical protein